MPDQNERPMARAAAAAPNRDPQLAELIRTGQVRAPMGMLPADFWDMPRVHDPEGGLTKALLEEREEGR
ncbi:MAG: hypothetical protein ACT443_08155 [Gemmatimonadota bacterium]